MTRGRGDAIRAARIQLAREVRQLLRDRLSLITVGLAPVVLAVIASVSLGAEPEFDVQIAIAGPHANEVAAAVADADPDLHVMVVADGNEAEQLVAKGGADAAVIFSDTGGSARVVSAAGEETAARVAASLARTAMVADSEPSGTVVRLTPDREPLGGAEVYGPVVAVFFVLFGVGIGARSLLSEREQGTLTRLLASPIPPWSILLSKGAVTFIIGMVEVALIVVTTVVFFGAEWGNLGAVTLVTALLVTCVMAIASLIAISARSPAQAQGLEFVVAVLLVSIGGHMVPYRNLPDFVEGVAQFTPNGAAIDAFAEIATGAGVGAIGHELLVIAVFAVVIGTITLTRVRRVLVA